MADEHFSTDDPTFKQPQTPFQKDFNDAYVESLAKIRAANAGTNQDAPKDTWLEDQQRAGAEDLAATLDSLPFEPRITGIRTDFLNVEGVKKGDALLFQPEVTRTDPSTGDAVIPLLFVQGMGGSNRLPEDLQALARAEQRMVIGLQYHSLVGSTKLVDADNMNEPAPEIDVEQADDLVRLLEAQGIEQVDAAGLSRGCIRLEIAMKQHPELFRDAYLLHPAGLDERTYRQSHIDAAREKIARITRRSNHNVEAISETSSTPKNRARRQNWRDQRLEQKSVARADLASTLGDLDPNIHVTVAGDKSDRAFQIDRLRQTSERAGVNFEETDLGGHVRLADQRIPGIISRSLRKMERLRAK